MTALLTAKQKVLQKSSGLVHFYILYVYLDTTEQLELQYIFEEDYLVLNCSLKSLQLPAMESSSPKLIHKTGKKYVLTLRSQAEVPHM